MAKNIHDPKNVTTFIKKLEPRFAELVEAIRQIILSADKDIGENIKWNSPAFFYMGEMKAFDPKEYKRDIVVFNVRKGAALLIFPTGATIKDTTGILDGDYTDGRRMITFKTLDEVKSNSKNLQIIIKQWINQVDK